MSQNYRTWKVLVYMIETRPQEVNPHVKDILRSAPSENLRNHCTWTRRRILENGTRSQNRSTSVPGRLQLLVESPMLGTSQVFERRTRFG